MNTWLFVFCTGLPLFSGYVIAGVILGGFRTDARKQLYDDIAALARDPFYTNIDLTVPEDCWYYLCNPIWMHAYLWPITIARHKRAIKRCRARILAAVESKLFLESDQPELVKAGGWPLPEDWSPRGELP